MHPSRTKVASNRIGNHKTSYNKQANILKIAEKMITISFPSVSCFIKCNEYKLRRLTAYFWTSLITTIQFPNARNFLFSKRVIQLQSLWSWIYQSRIWTLQVLTHVLHSTSSWFVIMILIFSHYPDHFRKLRLNER